MAKYDAIIVGSGPNGFAAAITLQQQGLSTLIVEGAGTIGGGMRTKELTLSGFKHDVCSAIHPMAMASPFMCSIPLEVYGLSFEYAKFEAAHPLLGDEGTVLHRSLEQTIEELGEDGEYYRSLIEPVAKNWERLAKDTMGPFGFPKYPLNLAAFGLHAIQPASWLAKHFKTEKAKALWAGMAAHGIQPLDNLTTSAIGLVLLGVGHRYGWAIPKGGSQAIANALESYYLSLGGKIQTGFWLKNKFDLPEHKVLLLDLTPKQLLDIEGLGLSSLYTKQLHRYKQGMGVFKIDWALSEETPFTDLRARQAATVHIGGTFNDIALSEYDGHRGRVSDKPFVLFTQQSQFDKTRAPEGKHTGWAYCHVPNSSTVDYTEIIENQIERFAPGFKDTILGKHTFSPAKLEEYNPNYIGGDINGGIMDISQLYTRPTLSLNPHRTSNKSVYLCSSATPPGGGVHGMCGFHAARLALKDHFNISVSL
ncbi:phytoene desaturase family protein [Sphingobacterium litopenaei]|uniref:NAD(P)/FAD-dependent oxidoreductase n=1 Tax=Sphingobacterium litopenaei TaxID=2763500 RepID=A0ABR7YE01_9SPHI|nr:NAD(P)/FAD-dependent oxidoreductase [Sphingobacterium litopenaei]MBD1429533.1 NAD(P)/FAD-dependent oxidoreductase [Sphingobacterium litopenaei]